MAAVRTPLTDVRDTVKKTFQLRIEGKNPARMLDATKHEIRQYIRRERRKLLPEGMDFWDFDCRFGTRMDDAQDVHVATLTTLIDAVATEGGTQFYLELLARPARRTPRAAANPSASRSHIPTNT
jgi:hypothetical protein